MCVAVKLWGTAQFSCPSSWQIYFGQENSKLFLRFLESNVINSRLAGGKKYQHNRYSVLLNVSLWNTKLTKKKKEKATLDRECVSIEITFCVQYLQGLSNWPCGLAFCIRSC